MRRTPYHELAYVQFEWQRPFELEAVTDMLTHLSAHTPQTFCVFEIRSRQRQVKYYLGADRQHIHILAEAMKAHGNIRFYDVPYGARTPVNHASHLKISKPILSLRADASEATIRAGLAAMYQVKGDEEAVIQIILGKPYGPTQTPGYIPDPNASFVKRLLGEVGEASAENYKSVKEKLSCHGFNAVIRLGAVGATKKAAERHILSLLSAFRTLMSAGVAIEATPEKPDKLNGANIPWSFPMRLSVKEIAPLLLLPSGETELPGVAGLNPKVIMPPAWLKTPNPYEKRTFAVSLDGRTELSISPKDALEHCHILGPTGSGKSTVMLHKILSDVWAGRNVFVIDPKYELITQILARIPKHREDDVIIIDPSSESPVGFNPLAFGDYNPNLVADSVLAVLAAVYKENWGIRSQDVLAHSLLTLAKTKGSSLLWLPTMLTDKAFRQKIVSGIDDKIGLGAFWENFENMSSNEQRQEILPVLNKIRQFLLRPGLRNILGQSNPKFNMMDLFTKPRIILCPLNKGIIGAEAGRLLGSLLVGTMWTMALSRASVPEEERRHVSVFIDELQDYLSLPTDLSDALAQARSLKVAMTLAHQLRAQVPQEVMAGIDANCRAKVVFGLKSAADAKAVSEMAPELEPNDFLMLPRYQIYTSYDSHGKNTGWISAKTLPMTKPLRKPEELRKKVAERYGKSGKEVEQEYFDLVASCRVDEEHASDPGRVGRKEKK